jgi:hypothetical protein
VNLDNKINIGDIVYHITAKLYCKVIEIKNNEAWGYWVENIEDIDKPIVYKHKDYGYLKNLIKVKPRISNNKEAIEILDKVLKGEQDGY